MTKSLRFTSVIQNCSVLCLLLPASCLLFAGCDQQQQSQLEKQADGVATSVQKTTAVAVQNALQETLQAAQTGGATWRVKTALSVSSRLEGAQIDVALQGQKIILRGRVNSPTQKTIAQSIAQNTLDPKFQVVDRLIINSYFTKKSIADGKPQRASR